LEYGEAADQVAASAPLPARAPGKARSGSAAKGATATCCGNCGWIGHNATTCQADAAVGSELDTSTQFILLDSGGDDTVMMIEVHVLVVPSIFDRFGGGLRYIIR
jgi:hypothetical protein